jgi:hypothetical protein
MQSQALSTLVTNTQDKSNYDLFSETVHEETRVQNTVTPDIDKTKCLTAMKLDTKLHHCDRNLIESDDDLNVELWDEDYHDRLRAVLFHDSMSLLGDERLSTENWRDLYFWIKEEGEDLDRYPFSFTRCCITVGMEPSALKESILYQLEKQKKTSDKTKQAMLF